MTPAGTNSGVASAAVVIVSIALALAYAALVVGGTDPHLSLDDSFITLVYARNLAETGAFFYNAGEPPIDGFTSLLDVVIKAVALRAWPDAAYRASVIVNRSYAGLLLVVCVLAAHRFTRGAGRWRLACCALAAWIFASSPDLAEAAASELEAPLYALLGVGAVLLFPLDDRFGPRHLAFGACVASLPLARPEGLALALVLLGAYAMLALRRAAGDRRHAWIVPVACLCSLCAYYAWRVTTFGHWAPNTYYAKTSDSLWWEIWDGLTFLGGHMQRTAFDAVEFCALFAAPALVIRGDWGDRGARIRFGLMSGGALVGLASIAVSGGDSYRESRRLLELPMTLVLLLPFALVADPRKRIRQLGVAGVLVAAVALAPSGISKAVRSVRSLAQGQPMFFRFPVDCSRALCERLASIAAGGSIAHTDFQLVKFFAPDAHVIDLEGLNDARIAHEPRSEQVLFGKFEQRLAIEQNAEVYVLGSRRWEPTPMARYDLRRILTEPALLWRYLGLGVRADWPDRQKVTPEQVDALTRAYRPASLRSCGAYLNFLIRKDVAARAARLGAMIGPDA